VSDREGRVNHRPARRVLERAPSGTRSALYRQLVNPFEPLRVFSDDNVEHIHGAALTVLEDVGIRVLLPEARRLYSAAGASVSNDDEIVRMDRGIVARALATVPGVVELAARDTDRNVRIGGRHVAVAPVSGPPNVTDLMRGRRPGSLESFRDFLRLAQSFDVIHLLGPSVEPQDVPTQFRHLEVTRAQLTLSNKVPFVFSRGTAQVRDCFEMVRLAHGISKADFERRAYCYTVINTNSPRQLDIPMAQGIIDFAGANQLAIVTPFTLAGAMAPITLAGALTLAHAEALAGIALSQIVRPGAPVVYGGFTSNVDMRTGSPAFGTPEYAKACLGAGQLARHVKVPWRSSNATGSNIADEQATYESEMSLWGAFMGGCNVLMHGAGWLEGGLCASYEKFILDIELLQMFAEMFQPVLASDAEIGLNAIAEVAPGGHYFSAEHTMQRYRSAFYEPLVSDWRNFGQWQEDGSKTACQRASGIWKKVLQEWQDPVLDQVSVESVTEFVARRRAEGGAPPAS
jgi:trimethylamine--corrinoid protein Co-methyltransferase